MADPRRGLARIPLPTGLYEWQAVGSASALALLGGTCQLCCSLLDGHLLWERSGSGPAQILGSDDRILVMQEQRRGPGSRWLEGLDILTGARRWRSSASTQALGGGPVIDGHLHSACPFEPGSLRIEIATGRCERIDGRPRIPGPGGWYGVARNRLLRFDGVSSADLGPAPKLGLMGVAGAYAILAERHDGADRLILVDLGSGERTPLALGGPHFVLVRGGRVVLAAVGRPSEALGFDPRTLVLGPEALGPERTPDWRIAGVGGLATDRLGEAVLAIGLGVVDARDGAVLVRDRRIDRACGSELRLAAWSSGAGEATLHGS